MWYEVQGIKYRVIVFRFMLRKRSLGLWAHLFLFFFFKPHFASHHIDAPAANPPCIHPRAQLAGCQLDLIVAVKLDLHGPVLELDAVEALDGRLRLLAGLEEHSAPPLGAARVGVADGIRLDDVAYLLEHLSQVLRGGRPWQVAHHDLQPGGRLGASHVGTAAAAAASPLTLRLEGVGIGVGGLRRGAQGAGCRA